MTATLHVLHPQIPAVAGFLRVGHTGHRKLEALHAAGRFPYQRVVFDAAHIEEQTELVKTLRASNCEIVLDPNFAEMATLGRYSSSSIGKLPWANPDRPWQASDFGRGRNLSLAKMIADFAVAQNADVVLAPSHLIDRADDSWRSVDIDLCSALRYELDRSGGSNIAIDYQIITSATFLRDTNNQNKFVSDLGSLPVDNIWIRASGFGATATGAGTRAYVEAVRALHDLGRPLVADAAGGLAALAIAAFGAVGGISHGVGQKESFDASDWKKPPGAGGGATARVYVHELDRYFNADQLNAIFAVKGGKPGFGCKDTTCCRHSDDMMENAHAHFITQRHRQIENLSNVTELRRAEHFLLRHLDPAVRSSRLATRLKINDDKVKSTVSNAKVRLERLRDALADLHEKDGAVTRSRSPIFRGGAHPISAVLGR